MQWKPFKDLIVQQDSIIFAKHWVEEFENIVERGK